MEKKYQFENLQQWIHNNLPILWEEFKTGMPFPSVVDSIICFIADINIFQR